MEKFPRPSLLKWSPQPCARPITCCVVRVMADAVISIHPSCLAGARRGMAWADWDAALFLVSWAKKPRAFRIPRRLDCWTMRMLGALRRDAGLASLILFFQLGTGRFDDIVSGFPISPRSVSAVA
ncbi:hypothetical protein NM208_g12833 [Fusarium decemcellulare]|uniref:Uncharacterized protein n=1 Tax=Fusarium decemcellulare TaxID=57161 RepID=A0ACC1RNB9_9HYPO|nr:hypothetical protein NM208_g12833 [Fusarium decemcellulare]